MSHFNKPFYSTADYVTDGLSWNQAFQHAKINVNRQIAISNLDGALYGRTDKAHFCSKGKVQR